MHTEETRMEISVSHMSPQAKIAQKNQIYVRGHPNKKHRIHQLRDELYAKPELNTENYAKLPAHLTILPEATIPSKYTQDFISIVKSNLESVSGEVTIYGAGVWPNLLHPNVLLLDGEISWKDTQEEIYSQLNSYPDITFKYPPTKPHITLFKRDSGSKEYAPEFERQRLQELINCHRETWETNLSDVTIEISAVTHN